MRQCTAEYRLQQNPLNRRTARCALSAKGIRYWEHVPRVLGYAAEVDHVPCPFTGEPFQWMRNLVLADAVAGIGEFTSAVVVAFADRRGLPMSEKASSREWAAFSARCGAKGPRLHALSYDDILARILELSVDPVWYELRAWVNSKIHALP
jgi:hypothetical protein